MNNLKLLSIIGLLTVVLYLLISCDKSTGPDPKYDFPDPIDSVATDISLYVCSDIYEAFICGEKPGYLRQSYSPDLRIILDTIEMETEGTITIDIEETDPYTDPPRYYIYAEADGFYTEIYYCAKGEEITVNLDAVAQKANSITGVIFYAPANAKDEYYANDTVIITGPNDISLITMTDNQGRYGVGNLPLGDYLLTNDYSIYPQLYVTKTNTAETDYATIIFNEEIPDRAPYIYLYPETQTDIDVKLGLLPGGHIIESEPVYNNGWTVNVTPNGKIDNRYDFLYYESEQSVPLSYKNGWILDGSNLEDGLRDLLSQYGFIEPEINDFIEFWMPKLGNSDWYAVYPQDAESIVKLEITPQPDNILRELLLIRPLKYNINIPAPDIKEFVRNGFTVAEWGVIWIED